MQGVEVTSLDWTSLIADVVSAVATVAAVVVAVYLGLKAVRIAQQTVGRSNLDYASGRADLAWDLASELTRLLGQAKAEMHIFFKDGPVEIMQRDARSPEEQQARQQEAHEVERLQLAAEVEAHRTYYQISAVADRLLGVLRTVQLKVEGGGVVPSLTKADWQRIEAAVRLYERTFFGMYFSLISPFMQSSFRDGDPDVYIAGMIQELIGGEDPADSPLHNELWDWLEDALKTGAYGDSASLSLGIEEGIAKELMWSEIDRVTDPVYAYCRPSIETPRRA